MYNSFWYDSLTKPFLNPPAWVFSPVWIFLYATLIVALIIFSIKFTVRDKIRGSIFFVIQLILNLLWSPIFFGLENIGFALIVIILLDIFVLLTIIEFFKVSKLSAYILAPYFVWIMFATYLNIAYFVLN